MGRRPRYIQPVAHAAPHAAAVAPARAGADAIACPRCAYDLSGAAASWATQCPLRTTCPECGLDIDCRDILNPAFARLGHFFEHARRRPFTALVRTSLRAARPRRFWTWVQMNHAVRGVRLVLAGLGGMLLWYLAAAAAGAATLIAAVYAIMALSPPAARYTPTGADWLGLLGPLLWPLNDAEWQRWGMRRGYGSFNLVEPALAAALIAAAAMPLAYRLLPQTLRAARVRPRHLLRIAVYFWVPVPLILVAWACAAMLAETFAWRLWNTWMWPVTSFISHRRIPLAAASIILWMFAWWTAATHRYLHLPRPRTIATTMLLICTLAAVLLMLTIADTELIDQMGLG